MLYVILSISSTNGLIGKLSRRVDKIDVFIRGTDNALWYTFWNNIVWSKWESLGGNLTADPAIVSWEKTELMYL